MMMSQEEPSSLAPGKKRTADKAAIPNERAQRHQQQKSMLGSSPPPPPKLAAFSLSLLVLFLLKRHVVSSNVPFAILITAWYLFNKRSEVLSRLVVLSASWPPCDFQEPTKPMPLPFVLRFLDYFPSLCKSFPGIPNARVMKVEGKRRIAAWHIAGRAEDLPTILHFKSPYSHRGQYLRTQFYAMLTALDCQAVVFDRLAPSSSANLAQELTERRLLKDAHAVWTATEREYASSNEIICWGSSVLGSFTAATLCLYLMRRGTPPACLVLENPMLRMPNSHEFDLESTIRAICSLEECRSPPILFVCAEHEMFTPAVEDCQRLASVASALSASQRVILCSLPCTQLEMYAHPKFQQALRGFIANAVRDATDRTKMYRGFSTDFTEANSFDSLL